MKKTNGIIWPKKEKVLKEYTIVAIGTIVITLFTFGVDLFAQYLLKFFVK